MKLINFSIGDDFISVIKDGNYHDLHNEFDFIRFNYDVVIKEVQLNFKKRKEAIEFGFSILNEINFRFFDVSFLKMKEGYPIEYPNEDGCLDGIGFSTSDMRHDMEGILASIEFREDYDMIFTFASDYAIKIHSKEVLLDTN